MKASLALSRLTGIGFTTSPAVKIEDFDKIATSLHTLSTAIHREKTKNAKKSGENRPYPPPLDEEEVLSPAIP